MRYVFADCLLDTRLCTLHRGGTTVRLRPKAFHVLQYLLEHRDHVVTKDELCTHVWPGQFISDATLEGCMTLARRAIGDSGRRQRLIQSRRGYGYRFVGMVQEDALSSPDQGAMAAAPGLPAPVQYTWVPGALGVGEAAGGPPVALMPLAAMRAVGRETEMEHLRVWLDAALSGTRQVVFVTGEAGLGKTTLVEAFAEEAVCHQNLWIGRGQCIEHYGAGEAYLPLLKAFGRLCRETGGERLIALHRKRGERWRSSTPSAAPWTCTKRA